MSEPLDFDQTQQTKKDENTLLSEIKKRRRLFEDDNTFDNKKLRQVKSDQIYLEKIFEKKEEKIKELTINKIEEFEWVDFKEDLLSEMENFLDISELILKKEVTPTQNTRKIMSDIKKDIRETLSKLKLDYLN